MKRAAFAAILGLVTIALALTPAVEREVPGKQKLKFSSPKAKPASAVKLPEPQAGPLPKPGVGLFFKAEDLAGLREKVQKAPCREEYARLVSQAEAGMNQWASDKERYKLEEVASKLLDTHSGTVPPEFHPETGRVAGMALEWYGTNAAPAAAFVYLMTGDRRYADFAWDVFRLVSKVNRWGWFPWGGAHMPQIHYGMLCKNLCLIADCVWDTLAPEQRKFAREVVAEKCVEPYYRVVLHTPGIGLYHLRSRNQGNNALAAALIGSAFVGDAVPDNAIWFNSLLQTYHWLLCHDVGWMGQNLEGDLGGYWSVSMQNLYTAAAVLANVKGIDLRSHPGFDQATRFPLVHEASIPAVGKFDVPVAKGSTEPPGIIDGKPITLPHPGICGSWWFDFAMRFPDSPAHYFAGKFMIAPDRVRTAQGHQEALGHVLTIAWWNDKLLEKPKPPAEPALFTDRMAAVRSANGNGETYLYFNGDLFLSAKNEVLGSTAGLGWHFPWHQYQAAETGNETEGEAFAPSMVVKEARHGPAFTWFRAEAGTSNVAFYPKREQRESHTHYTKKERQVLYSRGAKDRPDYFVFADDVRNADPRWHAWTWHIWNHSPENEGRFAVQGPRSVRVERPNADLWIEFLTPQTVTFEQQGMPGQPNVSYEMDHHVRKLRAIAGTAAPTDAKKVVIPPSAWQGMGVMKENVLYVEAPPTVKPTKRGEEPVDDYPARPKTAVAAGLVGGTRYRVSLRCKEQNYRVYEATAWIVELELLDKDGKVLARPDNPHGQPHPLRLMAPFSNTPTHDWAETAIYFDAPVGTVSCRASFRAVGSAHYFTLGKLWLGAIELEPLGTPARSKEQRFLTLVMPLDKGAAAPKAESLGDGNTRIVHANGEVDEIAAGPDGGITLVRTKGVTEVARFDSKAAGDTASVDLKTNSETSARRLAAGLRPVYERIEAERDRYRDRVNLARGAKATASTTRDDRFPASRVIDNATAEYPTAGKLDYTLGTVLSSGRFAGYGEGNRNALFTDRDSWPLYVPPTYWLLPENTTGHLDIDLKAPATVDLVRLLNTSNCGLNDFAAHEFTVELFDAAGKKLAVRSGRFGKVFDRPFAQAFAEPRWFSKYSSVFAGMLEPKLTVPFGDGWQEVAFEPVPNVSRVRVSITKFWGLGGGLNEVQVYGK